MNTLQKLGTGCVALAIVFIVVGMVSGARTPALSSLPVPSLTASPPLPAIDEPPATSSDDFLHGRVSIDELRAAHQASLRRFAERAEAQMADFEARRQADFDRFASASRAGLERFAGAAGSLFWTMLCLGLALACAMAAGVLFVIGSRRVRQAGLGAVRATAAAVSQGWTARS